MPTTSAATATSTPSDLHLPPGLAGPIAFGFDAKTTWGFRGHRIFRLAYDQRDVGQQIGTVSLPQGNNSKDYYVPDGMNVVPSADAAGTEATVFHGSHAVDEKKFATSLEASLSDGGVSVSASFALAKSSHVETDSKTTSIVISYYKRIYTFERADATALSTEFADALAKLPADYPRVGGDPAFVAFFDKWGTHYLAKGHFGGNWVMRTLMDENALDNVRTEDIKSSIEAKFKEGLSSGSTKSSMETSTKNEVHLQNKVKRIEWHCVGGDSNKELNDWLLTVDAAPVLLSDVISLTNEELRPTLAPIWNLQSDPQRQNALKLAFKAYLPYDQQSDDALPSAVPVNLASNVRAETDGFLSGMIWWKNGGDQGQLSAFTDGHDQPLQKRAGAKMHQYYASRVEKASLFMPVRKGDYYRIENNNTDGDPNISKSFQPFTLGFTDWKMVSTNVDITAEQDCFVVGIVDSAVDLNRGSLVGRQYIDGTLTACAGASVHVRWNSATFLNEESFCMPVAKGMKYRVDWEVTSSDAAPNNAVFMIQMEKSSRKMGAIKSVTANQSNHADTNGILFGMIWASDGDKSPLGYLYLDVASTDSFPETPAAVAAAEFSKEYDKWVPFGSAATVVRKGYYYRARVEEITKPVKPYMFWMPIIPA